MILILFFPFIESFSQTKNSQGSYKEAPTPVFHPDKKEYPGPDKDIPLGIPYEMCSE